MQIQNHNSLYLKKPDILIFNGDTSILKQFYQKKIKKTKTRITQQKTFEITDLSLISPNPDLYVYGDYLLLFKCDAETIFSVSLDEFENRLRFLRFKKIIYWKNVEIAI